MKKISLFLMLVLTCSLLQAKPKALHHMLTDNAVLQRNSEVLLQGTSDPNSLITIKPSWYDKAVTCTANNDGDWKIAVSTPEASFLPRSIDFDIAGEIMTISNLLIGDVWLATGQSNMQMPLKGFDGCNVQGGYDEIAKSGAWKDRIRFYNVPLTQSWDPVYAVDAQWQEPSPATAQDFSATAWYFAQRVSEVCDIPIGIVCIAYGGSRVESWLPKEILEGYEDVSLDRDEVEKMTHYLRPLLMHNAMFLPITDYNYSGIIWYQGCSNVGAHDKYAERLATMVDYWRGMLGDKDASLPFYEIEIAPYEYDSNPAVNNGAYLREAQWKAADLIPNSGIISTNNLAEPFERFNIHPANKAGVGRRLGNLALNKHYGYTEFLADSPKYKSHRVKDGEIWVSIDSPSHGICRNYMIEGFEVAGPDKIFYPADDARLHWQTNEIVVSSKNVPEPVAVRYCFHDFQIGTLYAGDYLPLVPFRSDNW